MRACLRGPLYGPQSPSGVRGVVEALETLFPVLPAHALCLSLHLSDHVSDFVCEVSLCAVRISYVCVVRARVWRGRLSALASRSRGMARLQDPSRWVHTPHTRR